MTGRGAQGRGPAWGSSPPTHGKAGVATVGTVDRYVVRRQASDEATAHDLELAVIAAGGTVVDRTPTMVLFEATSSQAAAVARALPPGATLSTVAPIARPAPVRPTVRSQLRRR